MQNMLRLKQNFNKLSTSEFNNLSLKFEFLLTSLKVYLQIAVIEFIIINSKISSSYDIVAMTPHDQNTQETLEVD
ncbi:CLUMA_CG002333, isoform A [Clunio marinus]|uniref:CLUMA_CG002333, isoform A n=1 Tax=Clunio marinus TaxID=568069 RepID=A0A1J1HKE2_9DIPT|nr:CLUMA_CG002333, isoform A [Clunio marinus]